jgi:hypothetical protein
VVVVSIAIVAILALSALGAATGGVFNNIGSTINSAVGGNALVPGGASNPTPTPTDAITYDWAAQSYGASAWQCNAFAPSQINDGSHGTWSGMLYGSFCGAGVDLGQSRTITGAGLYIAGGTVGTVTLSYSTDNVTWHVAYTGWTPGDGGTVSFAAVAAQYWQVQPTSGNGDVYLAEFELDGN